MEKIKGFAIPFDISHLKRRADLIEQDGPLLSLYYNDKGDYYLFYWLDCDATANRWMFCRVDIASLYAYLRGERSLLQVIRELTDGFVWITDLDAAGRQVWTRAVPLSALPSAYLPADDSFFAFDRRQELLEETGADRVEVDIPKADKNLFSALMAKMGWKWSAPNVRKLLDNIAL